MLPSNSAAPVAWSAEETAAAKVALEGTTLERARVAARALAGLMRDPNDTRHAFVLSLALNGRVFPRFLAQFLMSDEGLELRTERPSIDSSHVDLDRLRALPEGTLGRAYIRYLDDNKLDPDMFQAPPGLPTALAYVSKRLRQSHDVWHVLTGYRPDVPGEIALQAFTYAQTKAPASGLIAVAGALRWMPQRRGLVRETIRGYRRGKRASFLGSIPWERHWDRPLSEVRRELGIA
jgi:ubiquinone biosynthesis protein COQ4